MGKYFGTDGVRGRANEGLTLDMAIQIGQYLGMYYGKEKHARILIGKDTRLSGDMFELGLAAGATSMGAQVYLLGVCPTPAVSYLIQKERFDCGIMVSASHNPYYDNGIKVFNHNGEKMEEEVLLQIEDYIDGKSELTLNTGDKIGEYFEWQDGLEIYMSWLKEIVPVDLSGFKIAVDNANGSATSTAIETLDSLGATVEAISNSPNGININKNCGSTHPEKLQQMVKEGDYDIGLAFDGDADRLIAVNAKGELVDGDYILYICSRYMKSVNRLNKNMCVTTVMANLGLYKALDANKIDYVQTPVGDKYVFEEMQKNDYYLGGEQSGHIIFYENAVTGDGLLTALKLLEIMKNTGKSLEELSEGLFIYPQLLKNVKVNDKEAALKDEALWKVVKEVEDELKDEGRILVRPSGTEPLVRVMVEAKTDELCQQYVQRVVDFIEESQY
ncbi:phosphoglucosamine mutase [Faecalicoccus pleomorphus]|uniref:phosphoglucosamine mutase n=1 Tax=Faecalicoccus pleomorphus TaxID=1323 RepID=UPI0018970801|nr:phosphoglucosamine mutase [Faecalicoccus pleomorphus]MDB7983792.1 phosphoglucosamine mutase [Faecalicoccus pleomorphus]MDB7986726.1 phosphoglucosamine mutase [Faecalicoccus pleomorphus]MDB7990456.1 phosphoglucosamine mutase [Faecalicoccus pleomorphus]